MQDAVLYEVRTLLKNMQTKVPIPNNAILLLLLEVTAKSFIFPFF